MLTRQQLTATAVDILATELDQLAVVEMDGIIGNNLCLTYCGQVDDHEHPHTESVSEVNATSEALRALVAALRADLTRHAAAHGITLPAPA